MSRTFTRFISLAPTLLILSTTAYAADETVTIRDLTLRPMGNLGSDSKAITFHPKAMLTAGYDSNVFTTQNDVKSDTYGAILAGIESRYTTSDNLVVSVDLQGQTTAYKKETDRNLIGGIGTLRADWKGDVATAGANANYQRFDDPLVQTGERIQRENADGSLYVGWEGVSTKGQVSGGARSVRYLEDKGGFNADQRTNTGALGSAKYSYIGGENGEIFAAVKGSSWNYRDDTKLHNGSQVSPSLGMQANISDKLSFIAEAGVDFRKYKSEFVTGSGDEAVTSPVANLGLNFPWNERSVARVRGYLLSDNSQTSNAYRMMGTQLSVKWGWTEQFALVGSADAFQVNDTTEGLAPDKQRRNTVVGSVGGQYEAVRGLIFRLTGRDTFSYAMNTGGDDYKRAEVVLDTAIAF